MQVYIKCPEDHFHEIFIGNETNIYKGLFTQADFDKVVLLVQEQYQKIHPNCLSNEHFAKPVTVYLLEKNRVVYLKRDEDPLPENVQPLNKRYFLISVFASAAK